MSNKIVLNDGRKVTIKRVPLLSEEHGEMKAKIMAMDRILLGTESQRLETKITSRSKNIDRLEVQMLAIDRELQRDDIPTERREKLMDQLISLASTAEGMEKEISAAKDELTDLIAQGKEYSFEIASWALSQQCGFSRQAAEEALDSSAVNDICAAVLGYPLQSDRSMAEEEKAEAEKAKQGGGEKAVDPL